MLREKNVWLEIDEPHHFDKNGAYKERDIKRQKEIQEALNCKFRDFEKIIVRKLVEKRCFVEKRRIFVR